MNLPFELHIALRYLLAKRKQAFISVISFISTLGVTVGVMALVIALALMTGLQGELRNRIVGSNPHVYVWNAKGIVDYHTEVKPLPQFASREGKQRASLRAGEHLFAQTAQTFAYLRKRVESGELVLPDGSLETGQFGQQALQKRA